MTAPFSIKVYARTPDGAPIIIPVPDGDLTTASVDAARAQGGVGITIVERDRGGRMVDKVVVRS